MADLEDSLTIIITTSPTPSCPSPELVASVLASLPPELGAVPLIITFDHYSQPKSPHHQAGGRLKRGQVPAAMAAEYPAYINNVKSLFHPDPESLVETEDPYMHAFLSRCDHRSINDDGAVRTRPVLFLRQVYRQGFAFSLKSLLPHVRTQFLLVLQHDWVFTSPPPPFRTLLAIMSDVTEPLAINYVTFVARMSLRYERSRGGVHVNYGAVLCAARAKRRDRALQDSLVACLHFFDRPHLCSTDLYRQIFRSDVLRRGDFVEDTLGCAYVNAITAAETPEASIQAWQKYGAWMYYPDDGEVVAVRHTSGRTCLTQDRQRQRIEGYVEENRARRKEGEPED